jgi:hypothetical protein
MNDLIDQIQSHLSVLDAHQKSRVLLIAALEKLKAARNMCGSWADDHIHLQELCVKAGFTQEEVEGDGYGCVTLADMLYSKITPHG